LRRCSFANVSAGITLEGSATNIKGKIKEGVGKMTGDSKTEAEGKAEQVKGNAQNAVGGLKDKAREALNGED
jgi:uncharacterized protein YjbJ (UPF0337 family)